MCARQFYSYTVDAAAMSPAERGVGREIRNNNPTVFLTDNLQVQNLDRIIQMKNA